MRAPESMLHRAQNSLFVYHNPIDTRSLIVAGSDAQANLLSPREEFSPAFPGYRERESLGRTAPRLEVVTFLMGQLWEEDLIVGYTRTGERGGTRSKDQKHAPT